MRVRNRSDTHLKTLAVLAMSMCRNSTGLLSSGSEVCQRSPAWISRKGRKGPSRRLKSSRNELSSGRLVPGVEELLRGERALADPEEVVRVQSPRLLVEGRVLLQAHRERVRGSAAAGAELDDPVLAGEAVAPHEVQELQLPLAALGVGQVVRQLHAVEHRVEPAERRHEFLAVFESDGARDPRVHGHRPTMKTTEYVGDLRAFDCPSLRVHS
ncbi:hypothetical protein [Streptomyces blattellae]|uniref:hypothetical protein n=1 Tax=Streptomyces blattellae TaxID=2569855 RepID=UPI0012B83491|nr:hypothetical protein [Streptomyces blattellae]